jgi:hypothetical protein
MKFTTPFFTYTQKNRAAEDKNRAPVMQQALPENGVVSKLINCASAMEPPDAVEPTAAVEGDTDAGPESPAMRRGW